MNEVTPPASGSKRQRSRQACEACRLRKRKCDGAEPCSQCVSFEYHCHYQEKTPAAPPAKARRLEHSTGRSESSGALSPPSLSNTGTSNGTRGGAFVPFAEQPGLSDPIRAKFAPSESAIAFPRLLGGEFSPERAPRLHCFGWNTGIRLETPEPNVDVTKLLTLEEAKRLSDVYFEVVHPEIGFLDRDSYNQKVELRYNQRLSPKEYDCIIAGVTSLGSFFSEIGHKHESDLQNLLSEVLHISCGIYFPIINHTAAYILRTLYLRCTTRPNASWSTSCAMIHAIESTGVHKDHGSAPFSNDASLDTSEIEYRRRIFWVAWALHGILSKEYGRTKVHLDITTNYPKLDHKVSVPFLLIAQCLETDETPKSHGDNITMLIVMLEKLSDLKVDTDFQTLLKTDMIFAVYRRLHILRYKITMRHQELVLAAGSASLLAARRLADARRPWWTTISTPFQFVLVALAIDSPESFSILQQAISLLSHVSSAFGTHMVREALEVALTLVKLAQERKAGDLRKIESAIIQPQSSEAIELKTEIVPVAGLDDPMFWHWIDDTFAWDLVLGAEKPSNGIAI